MYISVQMVYGSFMDTGLDKDATDLLAACVEANVRMASHTTNLLLEGKEAQLHSLAEGILALVDGLMKIPPMIRPVYIDDLLLRHSGTISAAELVLDTSVT